MLTQNIIVMYLPIIKSLYNLHPTMPVESAMYEHKSLH